MVSSNQIRDYLVRSSDGSLRVAVNLSNFLLVSTKDPHIEGVAPSFAKMLATEIDIPHIELLPYAGPDKICDAAAALAGSDDGWDIALIGADPLRETNIAFTRPYCEIRACFVVRKRSGLKNLQDIDQPGIKIISKKGAAYDLWLQQHLQHAQLIGAKTLDESFETFKRDESIDVLAGLRIKLSDDLKRESEGKQIEYTVLDTDFMSVEQAVGVRIKKGNIGGGCVTARVVAEYLNNIITNKLQGNEVDRLIREHKREGKLIPSK